MDVATLASLAERLDDRFQAPQRPSEVTRALWVAVADHYRTGVLRDVWEYNRKQIEAYRARHGAIPTGVQSSMYYGMAVEMRLSGHHPDPRATPHIASIYRMLQGQHCCWGELQRSVEGISLAWESVNL